MSERGTILDDPPKVAFARKTLREANAKLILLRDLFGDRMLESNYDALYRIASNLQEFEDRWLGEEK